MKIHASFLKFLSKVLDFIAIPGLTEKYGVYALDFLPLDLKDTEVHVKHTDIPIKWQENAQSLRLRMPMAKHQAHRPHIFLLVLEWQ